MLHFFPSRKFFKIILILTFVFFLSNFSYSQTCAKSIDTDRITQKRKKKFIKNNYLKDLKSLDDLSPTCVNYEDSLNYHFQYDSYIVKYDINKVWNAYKNIRLSDSYTGHIVSFGFMYSKTKKLIVYPDGKNYEGMSTGQVFFINLDLLGGLKSLVVAYEVTNIDEENKTIRFCYINHGVSEGSQSISLSSTAEGYTKIQHNTIYKSNSKIRDKYIYPRFHKMIVKELHKNLMITL